MRTSQYQRLSQLVSPDTEALSNPFGSAKPRYAARKERKGRDLSAGPNQPSDGPSSQTRSFLKLNNAASSFDARSLQAGGANVNKSEGENYFATARKEVGGANQLGLRGSNRLGVGNPRYHQTARRSVVPVTNLPPGQHPAHRGSKARLSGPVGHGQEIATGNLEISDYDFGSGQSMPTQIGILASRAPTKRESVYSHRGSFKIDQAKQRSVDANLRDGGQALDLKERSRHFDVGGPASSSIVPKHARTKNVILSRSIQPGSEINPQR